MIVNINPLLIEIDFLIIIYYEKILCSTSVPLKRDDY